MMKMTSLAMTQPEDPWRSLVRPQSSDELVAKRVNASGKWNFFWAVDHDGHRLLVLRHQPEAFAGSKLPAFRGFDVVQAPITGNEASLAFRLLDEQQKEPFQRLCLDIVEAAEERSVENEAIAVAIARTWRWHYLLRGGANRLGVEEQKGLLAELLTLRDLVAPKVGMPQAVEAWVGPLGAVHDFRLRDTSIECKAGRGSGDPFVAISSEHQLVPPEPNPLFLRILMIQQCEADTAGAATLADAIGSIVNECEKCELAIRDLLSSKLQAAGALGDQDLSETWWLLTETLTVQVKDPLPRLVPDCLPLGVSGVRYGLSVDAARLHAIDEATIFEVPQLERTS